MVISLLKGESSKIENNFFFCFFWNFLIFLYFLGNFLFHLNVFFSSAKGKLNREIKKNTKLRRFHKKKSISFSSGC